MRKLVCSILIGFMVVGCASAPRLSSETVFPNDIVVEWPKGVAAKDVETVDVDGRATSVAPYSIEKARDED